MWSFPAQRWRYIFELNDEQKFIYALSEKSARKKFKKAFGVEAGELIERHPW